MEETKNMENENTAQQHKNSKEWLQPYQFKKGQSGNPSGRKAGKSLKEYAREMLASMTDEERQEYRRLRLRWIAFILSY